MDISELNAEVCAGWPGTEISVRQDADVHVLKIDSVKQFQRSVLRDRPVKIDGSAIAPRSAFALTLIGPSARVLPQGLYPMSHSVLGEVDLFLSYLGHDQDGAVYEIVFN